VPPQLCHSLRVASVNDADLAAIAGHRVEAMLARYTHPTQQSFQAVKVVVHQCSIGIEE
jgi:hypothetical protein